MNSSNDSLCEQLYENNFYRQSNERTPATFDIHISVSYDLRSMKSYLMNSLGWILCELGRRLGSDDNSPHSRRSTESSAQQ